jgi:dihydropteroate synthase
MVGSRAVLRIGSRELVLGRRTYVMGILNVSPDSFSGDGISDLDRAVERGRQAEAEGADILDVGGESTRPETWSTPPLPVEAELARVIPVVERLRVAVGIPISIDTSKAAVAEAALGAGAAMVNDVSGLKGDPRMAAVIAAGGVPLVVMHNQPLDPRSDLIAEIIKGLEQSLAIARRAGIGEDRIIVDPGIGFHKNPAQNLELLRRLHELSRLGLPLLLGPSRKSFIGGTLDLPVEERLEGTAAAVALAIAAGADLVRVHDVRAMVRVARMADAIVRPGRRDPP